MDRDDVLAEAKKKINTDRAEDYGDAFETFERISDGWNLILNSAMREKGYFDATDHALMMIWLKIARLLKNPTHEDSWVDLVGYGALGAECATKGEERRKFANSKINSLRTDPPLTAKK